MKCGFRFGGLVGCGMLPEEEHCEISYYLWDLCLLPWLSSILAPALCSTYHSHSNHPVR
jgi:hypothetical protein